MNKHRLYIHTTSTRRKDKRPIIVLLFEKMKAKNKNAQLSHLLKLLLANCVLALWVLRQRTKPTLQQNLKSHFFAIAQGLTIRMNKLAI